VLRWAVLLTIAVSPRAGSCAAAAQPRTLTDFREIILRAKERVYPALIHVKPVREEFTRGERKRTSIIGSGVIISPDGLAVTNNHVARKAVEIRCVLFDKSQCPAEVVGLDPETDLALLRLRRKDGAPPLPCAEFADSDKAEEGDFVLALGSPYGFSRSISLGIISYTKRYFASTSKYSYNLWLQTDVAVSPGNSGGPLVDTEGKVVGITTRAVLGMGSTLAFAIPSNVVRRVAARLKQHGKVIRAWTGIRLQALKDFSRNTFFDGDRGVLVASVDEASPAEEAGLKTGDLILAANETELNAQYVEDLPQVRCWLADLPPSQPAQFRIRRGGNEKTLALTPRIKGDIEGQSFYCKRWDLTVKSISKFEKPSLYYFAKTGLYVEGAKRNGAAYKRGLRANDIIVSIDRTPVRTVGDIRRVYERLFKDRPAEKQTLFEIMRGRYKQWIVLKANKPEDEKEGEDQQ